MAVAKKKLGYSNNSKDWAISSQTLSRNELSSQIDMSPVKRLDGDG